MIMKYHDELRKELETLSNMERGKASEIVTEVLKYIMDQINILNMHEPEKINNQLCPECKTLLDEYEGSLFCDVCKNP